MNNETFYLIRDPELTSYFVRNDPNAPEYLRWGYFISPTAFGYGGDVVYKGSEFKCIQILHSITSFSLN